MDQIDCGIPTKSTHTLLNALFMGVKSEDEEHYGIYTNSVNVSFKHVFTSKSVSLMDARSLTERKVIRALCDIDNKFAQHRQHNEVFPNGFGADIEKYAIQNNFSSYNFKKFEHFFQRSLIHDAFKWNNVLGEDLLGDLKTVLSGIVQTNGNCLKTAKVIALTTGTKHIDAAALFEGAGKVLADTHCEVVARRCLVNYLYDQIRRYLDSRMSININYIRILFFRLES